MEYKNFSRMVDRIISESLREAYEEFLAEQRRNEHVDRIINESIRKIALSEGKKQKKEEDKKGKGENKEKNARRTEVYKDLKKDGVNTAQYAYKLYPNKDEASARGLFMKKLNHDLNDNGYPYQFNSKEINRLYSMLSNGTLS